MADETIEQLQARIAKLKRERDNLQMRLDRVASLAEQFAGIIREPEICIWQCGKTMHQGTIRTLLAEADISKATIDLIYSAIKDDGCVVGEAGVWLWKLVPTAYMRD